MTTTPTEADPQAIIANAQQEEREAAALVTTLEEKVRDGDESVTFEEVEKARGLLSFVRLRQEAARRKAAKAQEAARLAACEALYADIVSHAEGEGAEFSKLLQTATDAFAAFHDAVEARNERVRGYWQKATDLGVPEHKHNGPAPTTHGGVRLGAGSSSGLYAGVVAGRRRVDSIDANVFMNRALDVLKRQGKFKEMDYVDAGVDLFGDLERIDAEIPESADAKYFYRNPSGTVFRLAEPLSEDVIRNSQLTVITKAEADAE